MSNGERELAARLLSGQDRLSALEKEQMLSSVLQSVGVTSQKQKLNWLPQQLAWVLAACGVLLLVPTAYWAWPAGEVPAVATSGEHAEELGELRSKGVAQSSVNFSVSCTGRGADAPCQPGDKLVFAVQPGDTHGYFSAFAVRPDGAVVWYFPAREDSRSVEVTGDTDGVLNQGVMIGSEHQNGQHEIVGVFSTQPLSREQVRRGVVDPQAETLLVLRRLVQVSGP